jgi:uncharacterized protein YbaR (Trm112 family)
MSMLTERLQILVSPQQKRRLEAEAKTRGESVGELVREVIDERYGNGPTRAERMAAVERMVSGPKIPFMTPEEINRAHEEEIEEEYPEFFPVREAL